jgi:hypothetical protein
MPVNVDVSQHMWRIYGIWVYTKIFRMNLTVDRTIFWGVTQCSQIQIYCLLLDCLLGVLFNSDN